MIPKIAHFVWLVNEGTNRGRPIPQWALVNYEQFQRLHQGWDLRITRGIPDSMPEDLARLTADTAWLPAKSDIIRLWLLHKHGGVYNDFDTWFLRNIEGLLDCEFYAYERAVPANQLNNSSLGSVPGSPATEYLLDAIRGRSARKPPLHWTAYGPRLYTQHRGKIPGMTVYPPWMFEPLESKAIAAEYWHANPTERAILLERELHAFDEGVKPYAVHLRGASGLSQAKGFGRGEALLHRLRQLDPTTGAEVGVSRGFLSAHLLHELPDLYLYMVDSWQVWHKSTRYYQSRDKAARRGQAAMDKACDEARAKTEFAAERRTVLRMDMHQAAQTIADGSLDFAFLDADHTYEGTKEAIADWWRKVRPGGLLCGHDYGQPNYPHWNVKRAVSELAERTKLPVELGGNFTWYIWKPPTT